MRSFFVVLLEPHFGLLTHLVQSLKHEHVEHRLAGLGVTSKSQNNPVSTNGVNSAMTQSIRILRKIKKDPKS